jgi:hypothetical protein
MIRSHGQDLNTHRATTINRLAFGVRRCPFVLVLVVVLVLEGAFWVDATCVCLAHGGEPLWNVSGHPHKLRLSTSRAETCENRRLPGTAHRIAALWSGCSDSEAVGKCIALGYSREPPVATLSGRTGRDKCRQVLRHALKRLPSRRWVHMRSSRIHKFSKTRTRTIQSAKR